MKNIKKRIKDLLMVKYLNEKKKNKYLKDKLADIVIENRKTIDEITLKNVRIRELELKVKEYEHI